MNLNEQAVLGAVNIASTIHRDHRRQRYQATAEEVAEVLRTDSRMIEDYGVRTKMTTAAVSNTLTRLAGGRRAHRSLGPLVEKVGTKRGKTLWALSRMGARVLGA